MSEQKSATFTILRWLLLTTTVTTFDDTHAISVQIMFAFSTFIMLIMTYATWPEWITFVAVEVTTSLIMWAFNIHLLIIVAFIIFCKIVLILFFILLEIDLAEDEYRNFKKLKAPSAQEYAGFCPVSLAYGLPDLKVGAEFYLISLANCILDFKSGAIFRIFHNVDAMIFVRFSVYSILFDIYNISAVKFMHSLYLCSFVIKRYIDLR